MLTNHCNNYRRCLLAIVIRNAIKTQTNANSESFLKTSMPFKMDSIRNGWFSEINDLWPGQSTSLQIKEILHQEKSEYQNIMVLQTKFHGKALILDSAIQCTERDEFAYHEVIAFLPLCSHPKPEKVLIVGGGNGGAARETAKHPLVKTVKVLEIDEKVVEICAKFIPSIANGLTSPKVTLEINDGFDHLSRAAGEYDVIITDATDPVGHSASLFAESYFALLKNALKPGGIICSQAGFPWLEIETARRAFFSCRKHFENVEYATVSVPTFPSGQIGFIVASVDEGADLRRPKRVFGRGEIEDLNLRYYNDEVHMAAFALPNFVQDTARGEKAKVSNGDVEHLS